MQLKKAERLTTDVLVPHSHPKTLPDVPVGSIDPGINAVESNSYLETLIEQKGMERLTWDALTCYDQLGDLEHD